MSGVLLSAISHVQWTEADALCCKGVALGLPFPRPWPSQVTRRDLKRLDVQLSPETATRPWLDQSDVIMRKYAEVNGERLVAEGEKFATLYTLTEQGLAGLQSASEELHHMFRLATCYVLHHQDDRELIAKFNIPETLWPLITRSWHVQNTDTVSSRFDYALTEAGLKTFEYNADSASALMECGFAQDQWASSAGLSSIGRDISRNLQRDLAATWRRLAVDGTLHLLHDDNAEEQYHTLYMRAAAEMAGVRCKVVCGLDSLQWAADGDVMDADGEVIRTVWKTWSWNTVVDRFQAGALDRPSRPVDLPDVLLSPQVRVFEPLWTLVMSNKALLPVLCRLFPDHPFLLQSAFQPTAEMLLHGYAAKPLSGRCGSNVVLFGPRGVQLEERDGQFDKDACVYQELCLLPRYGNQSVQVNCFVTQGRYLGTVLRAEASGSHIIDISSPSPSIRVVPP